MTVHTHDVFIVLPVGETVHTHDVFIVLPVWETVHTHYVFIVLPVWETEYSIESRCFQFGLPVTLSWNWANKPLLHPRNVECQARYTFCKSTAWLSRGFKLTTFQTGSLLSTVTVLSDKSYTDSADISFTVSINQSIIQTITQSLINQSINQSSYNRHWTC